MEFEYQPDPLDVASSLEAAERDACVMKQRAKPTMQAVGHCYNCGEGLRAGMLFCDKDCRDDYEKRHPGQ